MIIDDRTESQRRWAFRAIAAENATSVLSRLPQCDPGDRAWTPTRPTASSSSCGARRGRQAPRPRRSEPISLPGAACTIPATVGDLKTFAALRAMLAEPQPRSQRLARRPPATRMALTCCGLALGGVVAQPDTSDACPPFSAVPTSRYRPPRLQPRTSPVGRQDGDEEAATGLPTASLPGRRDDTCREARKPGSRRAEQAPGVSSPGPDRARPSCCGASSRSAALQGVSVDRLGPEQRPGPAGRRVAAAPCGVGRRGRRPSARVPRRNTDVVIWTPRRQGGRPLTFRPLPQFAEVKDDPDDLDAAIDAAAGAIAPRWSGLGRAEGRGGDCGAPPGPAVLRQHRCQRLQRLRGPARRVARGH